jgi:hypothetical protein
MADVAVVGSGLAGFTAYQTLRRGLEPGEIVVFGTDADPAAAWRVRAAAIRQRAMRSESDGHCGPATFPGLALRSLLRRRSLKPLLETVSDRYHPTVEEFLDHVERTRERSGWDESFVPRRVGRVQAHDDGFEIDGDRFRHVLLAPGHPGLNVPDELRRDVRAVHAYEPPEYSSTVTVVGAGLEAPTAWLNALAAGAGLRAPHEPARRRATCRRALRRLGAFHRLPTTDRGGCTRCRRRIRPAGNGTAAGAGSTRGPLPGGGFSERKRPGHLRHRVLPGWAATLLARLSPITISKRPATGSCSADSPCPPWATGWGRWRSRARPANWAFPAALTLAGTRGTIEEKSGRVR